MEIHLRPATLDDVKVLLAWRNNPVTIANSCLRKAANLNTYTNWLQRCLSGELPGRLIYIAENNQNIPLGTVKSIQQAECVEISYIIDPLFRGQSYGKLMVTTFVKECLKGSKLKAIIKKGGNEASEAIAKSIGLKPMSELPSNDPGDQRIIVTWA